MPTWFPALAPEQRHCRKELGWGPAALGARTLSSRDGAPLGAGPGPMPGLGPLQSLPVPPVPASSLGWAAPSSPSGADGEG